MDRRNFLKTVVVGGVLSLTSIPQDKKVSNTKPTGWTPILTNCYLYARDDQEGPMFTGYGDHIECSLNGYAIIPVKMFEELRGEKLEMGSSFS